MQRKLLIWAAAFAVVCLMGFSASAALPATTNHTAVQAVTSNTATCASSVYAPSRATGPVWNWDHYNVDPYYPNSTDLPSYKRELRVKGSQAQQLLKVPSGAWQQLMKATPCLGRLKSGQRLDKMLSGGFWGTKIKMERNVRVKFTLASVAAWYSYADYNGKRYILIGPTLCGNLSLVVVPTPKTPTVYVWAWKSAQVGNEYAPGLKFPVYVHGNRNKQWTLVAGRWVKIGPFAAGNIPKNLCEIIKSPWHAKDGYPACPAPFLKAGRLEVVFWNLAPSKGAPAPTAPPVIARPTQTPTVPAPATATANACVGTNACSSQVTVSTPTTVVTTTVVTTTTTSTTTPAPSPPTIVSITALNDTTVGQCSANFKVTVSLQNGDSGTLTFSPTYGKMTPSTSGGTVSGSNVSWNISGGTNTYTATYCAPTEVPPGGKDNIVVTLTDTTQGRSVQGTPTSSPASPAFNIITAGTTPR